MKKISAAMMCVALVIPQFSQAWGRTGHNAVAALAERYLTDEAKAAIHEIIGSDNYLWELSNWPDEIKADRDKWGYSFAWHYVSIDDHENIHGDFSRSKQGDIISALNEMEGRIIDKSLTKEERWQALAFYIHLVGDIHQPLHVGNRQDRGGNDIKVTWFGDDTNIHSVWDSRIIDLWQLSFTELTDSLDQKIDLSKRASAHKPIIEWAAESKRIRAQAYLGLETKKGELPRLGYRYGYVNGPMVRERLQQGGYRLAARLNFLLGK